MTVENTMIDTGGAVEAPVVDAPIESQSIEATELAEMNAAWDKIHLPENVDRGADGKFTSKNTVAEDGTEQTAELEGAAEGEATEGQSTVPDVPLPPNLAGLEAEWGPLPIETKQKIAQRSNELNNRMADMGRQVASSKALNDAASEFAQYFNGNVKGPDGNPITPADGLRYLANIQVQMDKDAVGTLLSIADTYGVREHVAKALGTTAAPQGNESRLLQEIQSLKQQLAQTNNPDRLKQTFNEWDTQKTIMNEGQRLLKSDADVTEFVSREPDLWQLFVNKGVQTLGENASIEAVFKYAKDKAIDADPTLRAKKTASDKDTTSKALKTEAAKRAAGVNVTSTSTGKSRPLTDDEAMNAKWAELGMPN